MPLAREVLNGFTASEVQTISGLSKPMVDYLKRHAFLLPSYASPDNPRGRVRFYSYRDLVIARLIQRLREAGVQLGRLKAAVEPISKDSFWPDGTAPVKGLNWVVSDGRTCDLRDKDGFLEEFVGKSQRPFAFVVNVTELVNEVRSRVPNEKRARFTMINPELEFAPCASKKRRD
jgi:DNA-binding transcriptional MerR regulator